MSDLGLSDAMHTCRTCAQVRDSSYMYSLFTENESLISNSFLAAYLFDNLKIKLNDGLPQKLCTECYNTIQAIERFFDQTESTQDNLEKTFRLINKPEIEFLSVEKIEFVDPENEEESQNIVDSYRIDADNDTASDSEIIEELDDDKLDIENLELEGVDNNEEPKTKQLKISKCSSIPSSEFDIGIGDGETTLRYECPKCHKYFEKINTCRIHINRIHGLRRIKIDNPKAVRTADIAEMLQFKCDMCNKRFEKKTSLCAHMKRIHSNFYRGKTVDNNLHCDICDKTFTAKNVFSKHKMKVHGIAKYVCPHCNVKYNTDFKYACHLKTHMSSEGNPNHKCKYCLQEFSQQASLNSHLETHHQGSKPYLCTICTKKFPKSSTLLDHMRIHNGERRFKCNVCDKDFIHKASYVAHLKEHTGFKPFQCEHCGKHFLQLEVFKRHLRLHTGEKFGCNICGSGMTTKSQLRYHKAVVHNITLNERPIPKIDLVPPVFVEKSPNEKVADPGLPYVCTVCNKGFKLPFKLTNHFKMHTDVHRKYPCEQCEKSFRQLLTLQKHIEGVHLKLRPYKCQLCSKTFSHKTTLTHHMLTHSGAKPHTCTFCNKGFGIRRAMREHMRIHTGETPYSCEICDAKFRTLKSLGAHQKSKHQNFTACSASELQQNEVLIKSSSDAC